jgi:uncharacterized protein YecE (DUF72 family)
MDPTTNTINTPDTTTAVNGVATAMTHSNMLADVYIGTAGYSYPLWRNGVFYPPKGVTQNQELRHYSGIFPAVEINASFHGVPREETLQTWAAKTKSGFVFSLKVPHAITHESRLENVEQPLSFFLQRLCQGFPLERLGPILFQLPPSLPKSIDKLHEIAAVTSRWGLLVAFEFRHKSWYEDDRVLEAMRRHNFGLCDNISPDNSTLRNASWAATAPTWHYIRCHKKRDQGVTNYTDDQLASLAHQIVERRRRNITQYCYFMNEHNGNGPRNAKALMKLVKELSQDKPFVTHHQHWKPDPVPATIQSMFAKSALVHIAAGTPPTNSKQSTGSISTTALTSSSATIKKPITNACTRKPQTLHSFFASNDTATTATSTNSPSSTRKRPTSTGTQATAQSSPNKKKPKKGTITNFFHIKKT